MLWTREEKYFVSPLIWKQNHWKLSGYLGNVKYYSIGILPGLPWPGVVASDRVLSMSQIDMYTFKKTNQTKPMLEIELFDHLTMSKQMTSV